MEDCWFQRHLLNDSVRWGQCGRPLGLRQNFLYIFVYIIDFIDCIGYMSNVFAYIIDFLDYQILVLR